MPCHIFPNIHAKLHWDCVIDYVGKRKILTGIHVKGGLFHKQSVQYLTSNFLSPAFYFCQHLWRIKDHSPIASLSFHIQPELSKALLTWGRRWTEKLKCIIKAYWKTSGVCRLLSYCSFIYFHKIISFDLIDF